MVKALKYVKVRTEGMLGSKRKVGLEQIEIVKNR